jgi:hypothetical protein
VELFEMEQSVLARALEPWPVPLRNLDAFHLATAEYLHQQGEAIDTRLLTAAAAALGMPVARL